MKLFELNTHHTYLNIYPVVRFLSSCFFKIIEDNGNWILNGFFAENQSITLDCLKPGKLRVYAKEGDSESGNTQEEYITVEDAVKFGGGKAKNGFVFENSPWVFITSGDRLYIWNRETRESKIEYYLSPDTILPCENVFASCNFFVFKTHSERFTVSKQLFKHRQISRGRNNQNFLDSCQH